MTEALFGYKRLLCLVSLVVSVLCAIGDDTTPTLTTDYSDGGYCNTPWRRHNNSCYLFMTEKRNFSEASNICSDHGAHLVYITDAAENEFIKLLRSSVDPAWIGLYRQTTTSCDYLVSCDWVRLDGSHLEYNNWSAVASPSYSRCAIIEPNGAWSNSLRCEANLNIICEAEVLYPTTTSEATTTLMTTFIADPRSAKTTSDEMPAVEASKAEINYSSTYIGVGVFLGIIVTAGSIGLVVYFKRCGSQMKNNKATVAGTDYENVGMSSSVNDLVMDKASMSIGAVYENTLTAGPQVRPNNHVNHTGNHQAYEKVTHDAEVSPEYTRLEFTQATHTNDC